MNKTDIDWADKTWNPVTGCLHACAYCYARGIARRFKCSSEVFAKKVTESQTEDFKCYEGVYNCAFPHEFKPTLYKERLEEPAHVRKPQKIFAVSMGDLFGSWVPDEWIRQVFDACMAAPRHRYIFLSKANRYFMMGWNKLWPAELLPISVFGASAVDYTSARIAMDDLGYVPKPAAALLCLEPLHSRIVLPRHDLSRIDWVIVGAETGNRKGKVVPKRDWVEEIVDQCRKAETPVFLKGNLAAVWGEELIQEYPEVLRGIGA